MKAKNRLILFALIVLMMLSFADNSVWAATITSTQDGDFTTGATWVGGVAPVAGDAVVIAAGHTVTLNTSISLEDITVDGTLESDLGTRTLTITDDIVIGAAGDVNYTANGGFINWVITQAFDGTSTISNSAAATNFAVNNLTVGGAPGTTVLNDGMYVYGTMTVTASGDFAGDGTSQVYFSNAASKTLSFSGPAVFDDFIVAASSAVTTSSDFTVNDALTINSSGALTITGTATLVTDITTVTDSGTFTMASGTAWNMNGNTTLASDLNGIDADVTLATTKSLTLSTFAINGDGSFTSAAATSLSLNNTDGVEGALDLTGGLTLNADTDYTFLGGSTGFPTSTTVDDIIIGGGATTAAVLSDDSFTMTGDLTVTSSTGTNSFTQSSGTITFTSSSSINNAEITNSQLSLNTIVIATGAAVTQPAATGFTVTGDFTTQGTGTFVPANATTSDITFSGTTTMTDATGTSIEIGDWDVTGTLTLGSDLAFADLAAPGATPGNILLNAGTIDASSYAITLGGTNTVAQVSLTSGTFKAAKAGGIYAAFSGDDAATEVVIASGINFEVYGAATSLGMTFTNVSGAGTNGTTDINSVGNLTVGTTAAVIAAGTTDAITRTIAGNLTVSGTASMILPYSTTDELITMSGAAKTITVSSSASPALQFNYLTVTGSVTTSADYTIVGILTGGGTFTNSSNTVTYTPGANMDSPVSTGITFNNLNKTGAFNLAPATGSTVVIAGDLIVDDAGLFDFGAGVNTTTFSGTSKGIYKTNDAGAITFNILNVTGSLTANAAGLTTTVNGIALNTSLVADFTIDGTAGAAPMTVSGTFTAADAQTVTLDGTANNASIAGAGTKSFYDIDYTGATASSAVSFTLRNDITGDGTSIFTTTAGTINITGTTSTIDPTATGTFVINGGTVSIASGAIVDINTTDVTLTTGALTVASGGRLNLDVAASIIGAGGTLTLASGSTLWVNVVTGIAGTITHTGTQSWNAGANYIFGAAVTDLGFDANTPIASINDLTIETTAAVTDASAAALAVGGNIAIEGTGSFIAGAANTVTMSGTSKTITNAGTLSFDKLVISGTVTSATGFNINNVSTGGNLINVSGSFTQSAGTLTIDGLGAITNTGTLSINNLTLAATATAVTSASSFTVNGNWLMTNGADFDASAGTVTLAGTSKTLTTTANDEISFFNLLVSGSYTQVGDFRINLDGTTSALNVTGTFDANQLGQLNFTDDGVIANTGSLTFNDLYVDQPGAGTRQVTTASDFTVEGDFIIGSVTSSFEASAGTITFAGTSAMTGAAAYVASTSGIKLFNATVTGTLTDGDANGPAIYGDLNVSGTMDVSGNTSLVTFAGGTTKTITNSGSLIFGNLTVANTASNVLSVASDFSVDETFLIGANAKLSATAGTITLDADNDNATLTVNPTSATNAQFFGLSLGGGTITYTTNAINVAGDMTFNAATVFAPTPKVTFNGTNEQLIVGAAGMNIDFADVTINNAAGIKLSHATSSIAQDELNFEGTLRLTSGDIDLNGENILTLNAAGGNVAKLVETEGNTIKNSGSNTSLGHVFWDQTFAASITNNILGGLGAVMTTTANPGLVTVKRYHTNLEPGGALGASRWFSVTAANSSLNATLKLKFDGTELGSITSSNASMLYSDNGVTAGPWFKRTSSASTEGTILALNTTGISAFTGETEFWSIANVPTLTVTMVPALTKGLASNPITSGTVGNAIMGYTLASSSGTIDLSTLNFTLSRAIAASPEFDNIKLVVSDDNDFSTTDDNTTLIEGDEASPATITSGGAGDLAVTFDVSALSQAITYGTSKTYFLVIDALAGLTTATASITPSVTQADITPLSTTGVVSTYSATGTAYTFQPGVQLSKMFNGVAAGPLVAGQTSYPVFGFSIKSTSNASFSGFTLATDQDPSSYFKSTTAKVYSSTDNSFETTADNTLVAQTPTFSTTGMAFAFGANQSLSTSSKYFFVVLDAVSTVTKATSPITLTMNHSSLTSTTAAPQFVDAESAAAATSIVGYPYSFVKSTATLSIANATAAGNVSKGVNNQPLYGFTITSDNGNSVAFSGVTANVTLGGSAASTDFSNYRLWYDANENGYPDTGEQIATGTYSSTESLGNLVFGTFSSTQSITSSRKYIITANVASGAVVGGTAIVTILNEDYITLTSPAKLNPASSSTAWVGNTRTVVTPGTATKLAIVGTYKTSIETGATIGFAVQAQDASSNPANVSANQTVTIVANNATFTIGGTSTGTIISGTNMITVSPSLTAAAGSTTAAVYASGSSLTQSSATTTAIKVYPAAPTTQASTIVVGTPTATTIPVTSFTNGDGAGRIVVVRQGLPPAVPVDGISYTANTNVGAASGVGVGQTGPGSYVVSTGSTPFTISGLTPNQVYYVQVFEYNGASAALTNYLTTPNPSNNPKRVATADGTVGVNTDSTLAVNIMTDVDITSSITTSGEEEFYSFIVPSSKNNVLVKLSSLPANYDVQLYYAPAAVANMTLVRESRISSTGNEYMILNSASAGKYILKIFGATSDEYSSSNYTIKVTTSASELMSQQE